MKAKILFVTYGGGHAQALLPIVNSIKHEHDVFVLALTTASSVFNGKGYKVLSFLELSHLCSSDFINYGETLVGNPIENSKVSHEESVAYHGINYVDLIEQFGERDASNKYQRLGRQCFFPLNFMKSVLTEISPNIVVATSSPRSERAALEAASALNIPSLCLVDLFATQEKAWVAKPNFATKVCVLNEEVKQILVNEGREPEDIVVTGNPAFDKLTDDINIESSNRFKRFHELEEKKVIFWASQPEPDVHPRTGEPGGNPLLPLEIEASLINFVNQRADYRLIIRHHPNESRSNQYSLPNILFSPASEKITDPLLACDCLVTIGSTVALEAHLVGKPVITMDMSIFTNDAPFSKLGISRGVKDLASLNDAIVDTMSVQVTTPTHGELNATKRVLEQLNELIIT